MTDGPADSSEQVVLVVEDSPTVRALVARQLANSGFHVTEACDGQEAIEHCRRSAPDIVLLDVEMPKMDGYEVIKAMKSDPELENIPVVFLTGRETVEDVAKGLRLGAHDYLRKPFEEIELLARLSAAGRMKALQDELRRRHQQLLEVSRRDGLTGLFNRRFVEEQLPGLASSAARHQQPLAAVMLDIDHFKKINDTYGHAEGDLVLCEVADRMRSRLRLEDVLGRWGGEEFLIVLAQTNLHGAGVLAESIRQRVSDQPISISGTDIRVTVSLGCAASVQRDWEALLRKADQALYEAKAAGRNCVRLIGAGEKSFVP
jgi:diguanylate cyclase (GGDEF)-like protein